VKIHFSVLEWFNACRWTDKGIIIGTPQGCEWTSKDYFSDKGSGGLVIEPDAGNCV
jgi:hypothetical protein